MEVIRKELGEENDDVEEMEELANKLEELPLSAEARKVHYRPLDDDSAVLLSLHLSRVFPRTASRFLKQHGYEWCN